MGYILPQNSYLSTKSGGPNDLKFWLGPFFDMGFQKKNIRSRNLNLFFF